MRAISCSLILALPMMIGAWELSLLHVNDIHARMEETNKYSSPCTPKDQANGLCFGGLARIVTAVNKVKNDDQVRQEVFFRTENKIQGSDAALWINAGDFFQGTLWYTKFKWRMVSKVNRNMLQLYFLVPR